MGISISLKIQAKYIMYYWIIDLRRNNVLFIQWFPNIYQLFNVMFFFSFQCNMFNGLLFEIQRLKSESNLSYFRIHMYDSKLCEYSRTPYAHQNISRHHKIYDIINISYLWCNILWSHIWKRKKEEGTYRIIGITFGGRGWY